MMYDQVSAGAGANPVPTDRLWGAALTLVVLIALLNIGGKAFCNVSLCFRKKPTQISTALRRFSAEFWLLRSLQSVSHAFLKAVPSSPENKRRISCRASWNFLSWSVSSSARQFVKARSELLTTEMPMAGLLASSEFRASMICRMLCFPKNSKVEPCV